MIAFAYRRVLTSNRLQCSWRRFFSIRLFGSCPSEHFLQLDVSIATKHLFVATPIGTEGGIRITQMAIEIYTLFPFALFSFHCPIECCWLLVRLVQSLLVAIESMRWQISFCTLSFARGRISGLHLNGRSGGVKRHFWEYEHQARFSLYSPLTYRPAFGSPHELIRCRSLEKKPPLSNSPCAGRSW